MTELSWEKDESDLIHIFRAIAIFCVVCAHMQWIPEEVPLLGVDLQIINRGLKLLGMLGVPVFYFVAGYCFKAHENCLKLLWHKRTIIVSWIIAGSIHYIANAIRYFTGQGAVVSIEDWLSYIVGSIFWYIPTLLIIFVLVNWFIKFFGKKSFFDTLINVVIVIGLVLNLGIALLKRGADFRYGFNPAWWSLFLLGMVWRKKRIFQRISISRNIWVTLACAISMIIFIAVDAAKGYCDVTTIPIFATGLLGIWLLGESINRKSGKEYFIKLGKASYFIYLYHFIPIGMINTRVPKTLLFWCIKPFIGMLVLVMCYNMIVWCIKRFNVQKLSGILGIKC